MGLDIGCGTGLHAAAVAGRGYTVVGVDVSADQLHVAASRDRRSVRADAVRLPLRDASVPAVVMTFTHTTWTTSGPPSRRRRASRQLAAPVTVGRCELIRRTGRRTVSVGRRDD